MDVNFLKRYLTALAACVIFTAISQPHLMAESVFLKDGAIINGTIVSDAAESITIRTKDKRLNQIIRSNVMRIIYTELKMGKIYVQKRDGKGIVAFLVDEDRDSYTFRNELYSPVEFKLKRSDILFMAEKNPSGLQISGDIETDRVSLKWLPPYDPVIRYNIYLKKNQADKYELARTSSVTDATIKKLSSNTTYYAIVTAVDSAGNESEPGNELKFTTKNTPPGEPSGIKREIKDNKTAVRWNESSDSDGKIRGYIIYNRSDKNKITEVTKPEYILPENFSVYKLEIAAVDDLGSESMKVRVIMPPQFVFSLMPVLSIPSGKLGKMFNPGYGATINSGIRNFYFQNFEAGLSLSFVDFSGKDDMNTDRMFLIPVTAYTGYHLRFGERYSFFPFVKLGESFSKAEYTGLSGKHTVTIKDPVAIGGVSLTAEIDDYTFSIGADYGVLYEKAGVKPFYDGFVSCGMIFDL